MLGMKTHALQRFDDHDESIIANKYSNGQSSTILSKEYGVDRGTILKIVRKHGVSVRPAGYGHDYGPNHPYWRGGKHLNKSGYVVAWVHPDDPMAVMSRRGTGTQRSSLTVLEHRLVMARYLKRPLSTTETVHHINGIKTDNRIENLQLRQSSHGQGSRHQCRKCGSFDIDSVPL